MKQFLSILPESIKESVKSVIEIFIVGSISIVMLYTALNIGVIFKKIVQSIKTTIVYAMVSIETLEKNYNEAINFFQVFYSSALKTNNSLKYGILTGITRIIKEGIFSGLNNLYVNTILSRDYSEYFGLLESEVVEMLDYFDMKYKIEEVREW